MLCYLCIVWKLYCGLDMMGAYTVVDFCALSWIINKLYIL